MDPPDHTRYRRLLSRWFTVRRVRELRPRIQEIVADRFAAMEQAGPPAELMEAFALPIPSLVICELLGVPYSEHSEFEHNRAILVGLNFSPTERETRLEAMTSLLRRAVRNRRSHPAEDLLSSLARSGELTDDELAGVGAFLLLAGHETTANMLALGTFALLCHPVQLNSLREARTLVGEAVEELLRYLTIFAFGLFRTAREDVELDGHLIRAGESVTVSTPAANRDPEEFAYPDDLDLTRRVNRHLAFGHGVHACIGQHLARVEMQEAYPALLKRFPGLRLAVPAENVILRNDMGVYGVRQLPLTW